MRILVGATTDIGRVRTGNEDAFLVDDELALFAVADGMGGHRAGEVASSTALEAFRSAFARGVELEDAVGEANKAVLRKATKSPEMRGMGTTLTAATLTIPVELAKGPANEPAGGAPKAEVIEVQLAHVGDSRAYLIRAGVIAQLTVDHSLVGELLRDGQITQEEAAVHSQRSVITRALGIESYLEVDTGLVALSARDILILCSDGLSTMVSDDGIASVIAGEFDAQAMADALVQAANRAGGRDNITAVVLIVLADDDLAVSQDAASASPETTPSLASSLVPGAAAPLRPIREISISRSRSPIKKSAKLPRKAAARARGIWITSRRVLIVVLPVLLLVAGTYGFLAWYAHRTFFVAIERGHVAIFQGVPGGLLTWEPELIRKSDVSAKALDEIDRADLADGHVFESNAEAERFVDELRDDILHPSSDSTSTSTSSSSTNSTSTSSSISTSTSTSTPGSPTMPTD